MKIAKLLHNPTAGDEEHSKQHLVSMIEANGFECRYSSTKKKGWEDIEEDTDFIICAGGDGTVRKIAQELLNRKILSKIWPIGLLPMGTANNIANTLEIRGETESIVKAWNEEKIKNFDVGIIYHGADISFFLESFGYGIFPYLMKEMKKIDDDEFSSPEDKIHQALKKMHQIVLSYESRYCHLVIDGIDYSGKFLLAEVMNIRSIGPNLYLAPQADPGDGQLDVIVVPEAEKDKFADYLLNKINGFEETFKFTAVKGKEIEISWEGTHVHVDDEIFKIGKADNIKINLKEGLLEFLVS